MRFLIADGSLVVRRALRLLLEHHIADVEILEAASLTDIERLIEQGIVDYALIDWDLPPSGGRIALGYVQQHQPQSRTIILSGRPEIEQPALQAGAQGFVSKGDPPDHLLMMLRHLILCGVTSPEACLPTYVECDPETHDHDSSLNDTLRHAVGVRSLSSLAA